MPVGDDWANAIPGSREERLYEEGIARRQADQARIDAAIKARAEAKTGIEAREAEAARATYYPRHLMPHHTLGQESTPPTRRPGRPAPPPSRPVGGPPIPVRMAAAPPRQLVAASTTDRGVVRLLLVLAAFVAVIGVLVVIALAH